MKVDVINQTKPTNICSWIFLFRRHLLLLKRQSIVKRNACGDLANSNQDCYTQKCTAFILPGPMFMQMSTGLAFGPVAHAHCHFCICHREVYLFTHSLHSPWSLITAQASSRWQPPVCASLQGWFWDFSILCCLSARHCDIPSVIWSFIICSARRDSICPRSHVLHMA